MNLDLKAAYDYGRIWIKRHVDITVESLVTLAAKVMARTGGEWSASQTECNSWCRRTVVYELDEGASETESILR